ncbi:MAG TPA: hypothetical protein VIT67_07195, partial [Povalibacter sp.]
MPDTTISSAKYNGFIHDVEADLNLPRPILAGGTGASNAKDARNNIDAEVAMQTVTNYSSHVWESGSFHSAASATAPPVTDHKFTGTAHVVDVDNILLEARDQSDETEPGRVYFREKKAGVWTDWHQDTAILSKYWSLTVAPNAAVPTAADGDLVLIGFGGEDADEPHPVFVADRETGSMTMMSSFRVEGTSPNIMLDKIGNAGVSSIWGLVTTGGVSYARWQFHMPDQTTESGGNAGSDFGIFRYNDAGTVLGRAMHISRQTGNAAFSGTISMGGGGGSVYADASNIGVRAPPGSGGVYLQDSTGAANYFWAVPGACTAPGVLSV